MNEKPLECTSCGKLKDYGEPHSFYDCVQYLKGVIQAKDAQIEALVTALRAYMVWEPARTCEHDYRSQMYRKAQEAIKEATS